MTDKIEVTQADRDAAADLWEHHASIRTEFARNVGLGRADDHYSVQAFARHRLASEQSTEVERLRAQVERAREALDNFVYILTNDGKNGDRCLSIDHAAHFADAIEARTYLTGETT